ncbi:MAG: MlrC C-terminal domain-containing protein [Deltaproteobacteria bacterium]|nr:MlrC C-terminal domain-containing protein [Deltaproteobacteria bacterium]
MRVFVYSIPRVLKPRTKTILVVKSAFHFYTVFKALTTEMIYIATPGVANPNFSSLPYKKADLSKWPFQNE